MQVFIGKNITWIPERRKMMIWGNATLTVKNIYILHHSQLSLFMTIQK